MKHLLLCCLAWPLLASAADHADLPPGPAAATAIRNHPAVRAALAGVEVGEAERDRLEAGPHEFNLRLSGAQRREIAVDRRLRENEIGIERAIRLPGKAAKDAALGAAVMDEAVNSHGDALHETGRLLLRLWFDWQREQAAVAEWRGQVDLLRRQEEIATKRVAVGDAAKMEMLLTSAQLAQGESRLAQAENRLQLAADEVARHFPALSLPITVPTTTPQAVERPFEEWRGEILEHSHELQTARAAGRRQQLLAQRQDAERIPDPTLGLRWSNERDGQEKVLGLMLSIPLPGAARAAQSRGAQAGAVAAAAREAQALAKVEGEARRDFRQAQAAYGQWQRQEAVAARIDENTRLLEKAWRLGEGQIGDLLNARRQAIEARLAAAQARLEANESRYRLLLDTHRLWPLNEEANHLH